MKVYTERTASDRAKRYETRKKARLKINPCEIVTIYEHLAWEFMANFFLFPPNQIARRHGMSALWFCLKTPVFLTLLPTLVCFEVSFETRKCVGKKGRGRKILIRLFYRLTIVWKVILPFDEAFFTLFLHEMFLCAISYFLLLLLQ